MYSEMFCISTMIQHQGFENMVELGEQFQNKGIETRNMYIRVFMQLRIFSQH